MRQLDLPPTTVAQALRQAQTQGLNRLESQLLLLHALSRCGQNRAWLLAHDTQMLTPEQQAAFSLNLRRRLDDEPLAYITGHQEFFGLDLCVDRRVLVPRPDTETLVQWALDVVDRSGRGIDPLRVLDLGTGSGAIALAIKATKPDMQVSALDGSADALAVARHNAQRLQLDVSFRLGNWLHGVSENFDVIVSNPPYIAEYDSHLNALRHEPTQALTSGRDGLADLRHIIAQAPSRLRAGGWLLLEHGYDQAASVRALLHEAGFEAVQSQRDLRGIERCSGGQCLTSHARPRMSKCGLTVDPGVNPPAACASACPPVG